MIQIFNKGIFLPLAKQSAVQSDEFAQQINCWDVYVRKYSCAAVFFLSQ